jgi:hypothetical protein
MTQKISKRYTGECERCERKVGVTIREKKQTGANKIRVRCATCGEVVFCRDTF